MSIEITSLLVEIVATLAVVITLIYLARQLRQNTEMMKTSSAQERVQRDSELAAVLIENREFTKIWLQSQADFDGLDEVDKNRIIFFERRAIVHWNSMFLLHEKGLLPDSSWKELNFLIQKIGMNQGLRQAWQIFKISFENNFQDFMEEQFVIAEKQIAK